LKKAAAFVQGPASAIYWNDAANDGGDVFFDDGGIPPEYRQLYFEKYVSLNPTLFCGGRGAGRDGRLRALRRIPANQFYQEWAKPQGWSKSDSFPSFRGASEMSELRCAIAHLFLIAFKRRHGFRACAFRRIPE
jgi:hypothetical protein